MNAFSERSNAFQSSASQRNPSKPGTGEVRMSGPNGCPTGPVQPACYTPSLRPRGARPQPSTEPVFRSNGFCGRKPPAHRSPEYLRMMDASDTYDSFAVEQIAKEGGKADASGTLYPKMAGLVRPPGSASGGIRRRARKHLAGRSPGGPCPCTEVRV